MKLSYRFVVVATVFVTCLISANVVAVKVIGNDSFFIPAAVIVFPLSYIFGDILTEVYGYRMARRVIWLGFSCNLMFVLFVWLGQLMPAAPFWDGQEAYDSILGYAPRLFLASTCGYLVGEFTNSIILARMKVLTQGKWLWLRTISSTIVGEGLDTALFVIIAYSGTPSFVPIMILYHWMVKTGIEIAATPLTYAAINRLKKKDRIDVYDSDTNFNPFSTTG